FAEGSISVSPESLKRSLSDNDEIGEAVLVQIGRFDSEGLRRGFVGCVDGEPAEAVSYENHENIGVRARDHQVRQSVAVDASCLNVGKKRQIERSFDGGAKVSASVLENCSDFPPFGDDPVEAAIIVEVCCPMCDVLAEVRLGPDEGLSGNAQLAGTLRGIDGAPPRSFRVAGRGPSCGHIST